MSDPHALKWPGVMMCLLWGLWLCGSRVPWCRFRLHFNNKQGWVHVPVRIHGLYPTRCQPCVLVHSERETRSERRMAGKCVQIRFGFWASSSELWDAGTWQRMGGAAWPGPSSGVRESGVREPVTSKVRGNTAQTGMDIMMTTWNGPRDSQQTLPENSVRCTHTHTYCRR